jgi:hypothetical protein
MLSSARPPEPCFFDCVGSSLFAGREVVRKHGAGPGWLVGLASGAELIEPGFDVDDGSAVDGVEIFYVRSSPSTSSRRQREMPIQLIRRMLRWPNAPTSGHAGLSLGRRAPRFRSVWSLR